MHFGTGPEIIKMFILNSTEDDIYHAHNLKMPTMNGILYV